MNTQNSKYNRYKDSMSKYMDKYLYGGNKNAVFERDGYKCVRCGMSNEDHKKRYGRRLTIDHINGLGTFTPIDRRDSRLENLQLLCCTCHGHKDIVRSPSSAPKKIVQKTKDGEVVRIWPSARQVEREWGCSNGNINQVLKGRRNFVGGFRWEYLGTED